MFELPRYFHPAIGATPPEVAPADALVAHALDVFVLGEREWIAGVDALGRLLVVPGEGRERLLASAHAELSHFEVTGAARRRIDAPELHLLELQLVEQPGDEPGPNDPVFLYGVLHGPLPSGAGAVLPARCGQLAVTRADVLAGLVAGAPWAFRFASPQGGGTVRRCLSLLLPGDRDEALATGEGLILAYPMMPPELAAENPANDLIANRVLADVLSALVEDLESRPTGFWSKVFSGERLALPQDGTLEQHLALAERALSVLPDWPSTRTKALHARVAKTAPAPPREAIAPSVPQPCVSTPQPVRARQNGPPAWVRDFVEAHHRPGTPAPRLTSALGLARHEVSQATDWRLDFAPRPAAAKREEPAAKPQGPPDWMKDFK